MLNGANADEDLVIHNDICHFMIQVGQKTIIDQKTKKKVISWKKPELAS